jgi:hypothetical protein
MLEAKKAVAKLAERRGIFGPGECDLVLYSILFSIDPLTDSKAKDS